MIGLELTDGTGRVWDLMGAGAWPRAGAGFRGYGRPNITPTRSRPSAGTHGSRWRGWRASDRAVTLPLEFEHASDLIGQVREFAAGIVPEQPGYAGNTACTLTAILPDSARWQLGVQLVDDGGLTVDTSPDLDGNLDITTVWDADVFWTGPTWSSTWTASTDSTPWLMASGGVAYLIPSNTFATASTTNAGDVRVWPVWTITGPATAASVGIGGHMVTLALDVTAGQTVTIDTDPEVGQMAVRSNGQDVTDMLTDVDWAPIEPGVNALAISLTGTGTVSMAYRPQRLAIL